MAEGREAARRSARAPWQQRTRRRWAIAGGVAASWVLLEVVTGSALSATVLLVTIAGLGAACVGGLRAAGITKDHPWIRRIASRPWRDGQDVLHVAMRHLSDVFVVTPSGALLAPNVVELQLNPDDLISLRERMELGVINASLTEVYEEQVATYGARFADESVPPGRYRLRQGHPVGADVQYPDAAQDPDAAPEYPASPEFTHVGAWYALAESGGRAWHEGDPAMPAPAGMATIMEQGVAPVPVLRLVTGSSVAETLMSGARAGRGAVELVLPDVPTVSREHATFTFSDGRWWITNQGLNGLTLNGALVAGEQPVSDGDEIRWGARPDALLSRVEIG